MENWYILLNYHVFSVRQCLGRPLIVESVHLVRRQLFQRSNFHQPVSCRTAVTPDPSPQSSSNDDVWSDRLCTDDLDPIPASCVSTIHNLNIEKLGNLCGKKLLVIVYINILCKKAIHIILIMALVFLLETSSRLHYYSMQIVHFLLSNNFVIGALW